MKIKHYYAFEEKLKKENDFEKLNSANWDILRTDNIPGPFAIERNINDFEENCRTSSDYQEAAEIICRLIKDHNLGDRLVSLGCGKGIVEWHIKQIMPDLYVECTDYAQKGIEQLAKVFVDCDEFGTFDMLSGDYGTWQKTGDILLMYRVSTEFSEEQWQSVFDRIYHAGINHIIFVPTEIMTLKLAIYEKARFLLNLVSGKKNTFCGWMYSRREFFRLFGGKDGRLKYRTMVLESFQDTGIFVMERVGE